MIHKIVSGGQTGANRAALDFAIEHDIPHGGWCPKCRLAEDGPIPARYQLQETSTKNYPQRTEKNVVDSDGTVIFTLTAKLGGGSKKTADFARKHGKPWVHLSQAASAEPAAALSHFLQEYHVLVLNVAGSRASKEPGVYDFAQSVLAATFGIGWIFSISFANPITEVNYAYRPRS